MNPPTTSRIASATRIVRTTIQPAKRRNAASEIVNGQRNLDWTYLLDGAWEVVLLGRSRLQRALTAEVGALTLRTRSLTIEQWDSPSRCEGWRVRDVLGHLVHLAETTWRSFGHDLREQSGRDQTLAEHARQLGNLPIDQLVARLSEAPWSRYSSIPAVALSEVVVHQDDMWRPLAAVTRVSPEAAVATLRSLRRVDRLSAGIAFRGRSHRHLRLVATDVPWRSGHGPEISGTAVDLAALLSNRDPAGLELEGPGLSRL